MSVATSRTARYGGAVATFTTAASPGGALTALFNAIDTMLTTAGWTRTVNNGSPGPNRYTSTGESGNEHLFIEMTTGAFGTASGVDLSGGSFLCISTAQWMDSSTNFCNKLGLPRLSSSAGQPSASVNCLSLVASTTYEYAAVCDKDGICVVASPSGTANGLRWVWVGNFQVPNRRGTLVTTNTVSNGSQVVINLSGNPITAGYTVGDVLVLAGQEAGGGTATLGDLVAFRVAALTSSSVTAQYIGGLSKTVSIGALVGEQPQPYHGWKRDFASIGPSEVTSGFNVWAPIAGYGVQTADFLSTRNLWAYNVSSDGAGSFDGSTAVSPYVAMPGPAQPDMPISPSGLNSSGVDSRTGASAIIRQIGIWPPNSSPQMGGAPGYLRFLWRDQRISSSPIAVGTIGRLLQTTQEWVAVQAADARSYWLGPFPATSPTVLVRAWGAADCYAGDYLLVEPSSDASGDDSQITIIDRPYIQDFVAPPLPTNAFNQGIT